MRFFVPKLNKGPFLDSFCCHKYGTTMDNGNSNSFTLPALRDIFFSTWHCQGVWTPRKQQEHSHREVCGRPWVQRIHDCISKYYAKPVKILESGPFLSSLNIQYMVLWVLSSLKTWCSFKGTSTSYPGLMFLAGFLSCKQFSLDSARPGDPDGMSNSWASSCQSCNGGIPTRQKRKLFG